jgi:hypothetical protein
LRHRHRAGFDQRQQPSPTGAEALEQWAGIAFGHSTLRATTVSELDARIKRDGQQQYLLANIHKIPGIYETIRAAEPIAEYFDDLRQIFGPRLREMTEINLRSLVRSGSLNLIVETSAGAAPSYYGSVSGTMLLDPGRRSYLKAIQGAKVILGRIDLPFNPIKASDVAPDAPCPRSRQCGCERKRNRCSENGRLTVFGTARRTKPDS